MVSSLGPVKQKGASFTYKATWSSCFLILLLWVFCCCCIFLLLASASSPSPVSLQKSIKLFFVISARKVETQQTWRAGADSVIRKMEIIEHTSHKFNLCNSLDCACTRAFVHQCDSGEALINSSPTLSHPPPISLNTHGHTKTQQRTSQKSAAWARQQSVLPSSLCLGVSAGLTWPHTSLIIATFIIHSHLFLMHLFALHLSRSRGCLLDVGLPLVWTAVTLLTQRSTPRCVGRCDAAC